MAFTGVHLVITWGGAKGSDQKTIPITKDIFDSETVASGAGAKKAPAADPGKGTPVFRLRASAEYYVAIGKTPNSAVNPRMILAKEDGLVDIGVNEGDSIHVTVVP